MADRKKTLETVVEDLDGEKQNGISSAKSRKSSSKSRPTSTKQKKNGKQKIAKKVIVDIPTAIESQRKQTTDKQAADVGDKKTGDKMDTAKTDTVDGVIMPNDIAETRTAGELAVKDNDVYIQTPGTDGETGSKDRKDSGDGKPDIKTERYTDTAKDVSDGYASFSRTGTDKSIFSIDSETIDIGCKSANPKKTTKIKSTVAFTKIELEMMLPRKSFFSSHDKTLRDAGFHIDNTKERKKPEWRKILRMHTLEELYPVKQQPEEKKTVQFGNVEDEPENDEMFMLEDVETAVSSDKDEHVTKRMKSRQNKKLLSGDREEYKPLYDYLKHINENPEEYIQMTKFSNRNVDHKHPSNMVRLGRAFRRGHHGVLRNNIYMHAICGLKPKMADSTSQRKGGTKKDSEGGDQVSASQGDRANEESELEKLKSKTEKWMKGLSTSQFLRAKEMAMKDIGEEDLNMSKWWLAFKSCKYLRLPQHVVELKATES